MPIELLLDIFRSAILEDEVNVPESGAITAFNIASVCRHWRNIALDYKLLWTHIAFRTPAVTDMMIERAGGSPLSLCIDLGSSRYNPYLIQNAHHALRRALSNARELCIRSRHLPNMPNLLRELNKSCDILERLELTALDRSTTAVYSLSPTYLDKPVPMRLRRLVLEGTTIEPRAGALLSIHCTTLTYLELRNVQNLRASDVLDVLVAASGTLENVIFDAFTFPNTVNGGSQLAWRAASIELSRLRYLAFMSIFTPFESGSTVSILRYLTYPKTATLVVQMHVAHVAIQNAVQDTVAAHLRARNAELGLQSALLSADDEPQQLPGLRLRLWARRGIPDLFNLEQHGRPRLDLRVTRAGDTADSTALRALSALGEAAGLANVAKMAVAPLRREVPWARLFAFTPILRDLSLYGSDNIENLCVACTPALMVEVEGSAVTAAYYPNDMIGLLGALKSLTVYGLSLRRGYFRERTQEFDTFRACLEGLRSILGKLVSELVVCYCDTLAIDMDELAPLVQDCNIIWDGSSHGTKSVPVPMEATPAPSPNFRLHTATVTAANLPFILPPLPPPGNGAGLDPFNPETEEMEDVIDEFL
jgi:hypothetical protein